MTSTEILHADDHAIIKFAHKMREKMRFAREVRGRGGWTGMSAEELSAMLRGHVEKGDPVDVANFCMMLSVNGASIMPAPVSSELVRYAYSATRKGGRKLEQNIHGEYARHDQAVAMLAAKDLTPQPYAVLIAANEVLLEALRIINAGHGCPMAVAQNALNILEPLR